MKPSHVLMVTVFLALFSISICSFGANFCVDNATDLQTALSNAEGNGGSDVIMVVQGTYSGNFLYDSGQGDSLALLGGYTAGCAGRAVDPANSVLDGGESGYALRVVNSDGGDCAVDGFTLQNGNATGDGGGVYAEASSNSGTAGDVTLTNNIISSNTSAMGGGGIYARSYSQTGTAGNVILLNNAVSQNSANVGGGVFASSYSISGTPGTVTFTNNTITGNSSVLYGGGAFLYAYSNEVPGGMVQCYNNIIRGNTGPAGADIYLSNTGTADGFTNDYAVMFGSWDNGAGTNIDADPLLAGDHRLLPRSPCIDTGTNAAPALPAIDIEGDGRIIDGDRDGIATVDMGADEYIPRDTGSQSLLLLLD